MTDPASMEFQIGNHILPDLPDEVHTDTDTIVEHLMSMPLWLTGGRYKLTLRCILSHIDVLGSPWLLLCWRCISGSGNSGRVKEGDAIGAEEKIAEFERPSAHTPNTTNSHLACTRSITHVSHFASNPSNRPIGGTITNSTLSPLSMRS
jgi:hypothetical protein